MPSSAPSVSVAPSISAAPSKSLRPSAGPTISEAPTVLQEYYTACGASHFTCRGKKVAEHKDTKHEVRCCSDTHKGGWVQYGTCEVWGESNLGESNLCYEETHAKAETICADNGARLCTAQELLDDCTRGSGCGHDEHMIWSADWVVLTAAPTFAPAPAPSTQSPTVTFAPSPSPSISAVFQSKYTVCGSQAGDCKGTKTKVEEEDTNHEVRCCSDTSMSGWVKNPGCSIWVKSDLPNCYETTYAEAESICANQNARLCTKSELLADCTRGSGCGHDNDMIWASDLFEPPTASPTVPFRLTAFGATGETGRVTTTSDGVTVNTRYVYADPVIVAFINTRNGPESTDVRVKDVTSESFRLFLEEALGTDGWAGHGDEEVSYIVMEAGRHTLEGGLVVEAGRHITSRVHIGGEELDGDEISFAAPFEATPVVITTLNTHNNGAFMSSLTIGVEETVFKISQEALQTGTTAESETIGWMAFSTGEGTTSGGSPYISRYDLDDRIENGVGETKYSIDLADANFVAPPDLVVGLDQFYGWDGAYARGAGDFTATLQTIYAEEDQSPGRTHFSVPVMWVGFGHNSDLYAQAE
mmetsp:Transcript_34187/g.102263  ORF Transcript_34187/g.102263 Transcript_34187/m.102263 type:complete len:586 (-) Transcript_34187:157-1914(-)